MNEIQIGSDLQRWIALTDAYARQIELKRISKDTNPRRLSMMASSLQKVGNAFERLRSAGH